jgi:hypothetical protein
MTEQLNENYLLKEVEKLNKEVESLMTEIRTRERYSLTVTAAVGGYLLLHKDSFNNILLFRIAGCIPLIITLLLGLSVFYLYENIKWIGEYLSKAEEHFYATRNNSVTGFHFGWEKFFSLPGKKDLYMRVTKWIWSFQLLLSVLLIIFSWVVKKLKDADPN